MKVRESVNIGNVKGEACTWMFKKRPNRAVIKGRRLFRVQKHQRGLVHYIFQIHTQFHYALILLYVTNGNYLNNI